MVASSHLVNLYRMLEDGRQTALALKARGPCEERTRRRGLQARMAELYAAFLALNPEEIAGEACAWQWLVEAQAGLAAFHGLAAEEEAGEPQGVKGDRAAALKALRHSLRGYRTAFPEELADEGIHQALETAAVRCSEAFALDADDVPERDRASLRRELEGIVREAFRPESLAGV
jgi:hypothetical protein